MKKIISFFIIVLVTFQSNSQIDNANILTLEEYIGFIKSFHPVVKQANLLVSESEAKLLKARGAFDPKIEVDYSKKIFDNTEYYDKLNSAFKIPTWYGLELKASYENNEGYYLNPENNTPQDGLYSVGINASLAQGLLINKRMSDLKQAKLYVEQTLLDRRIIANEILYEATLTYFNWLKAFNEKLVYESFLKNAKFRFDGVLKSYELGENPAIDTVEAKINLNTRKLELEKSKVKYIKASLELSNFLWMADNTPIEVTDDITPDTSTFSKIDMLFSVDIDNEIYESIDNHPKVQSLELKYKSLLIDKRLKQNNLLPKVDFSYNFLTDNEEDFTLNTDNYKSSLTINFPLFLRKERGDLKLAKIKTQDIQLDIESTKVSLKNKISFIRQQLESYIVQNNLVINVVDDYNILLKAEEQKFSVGESSLFIVNSRESKLIDARLKAIELETNFLNSKANLFNVLTILEL